MTWFDEYLAGVNYDERSLVVRELRLGDQIALKPERNNPQDSNAIIAETCAGKSVGFLRRELAAMLRAHFENAGQLIEGVITELSCDADGSSYRVRIKFGLHLGATNPTETEASIRQSIDYLYDDSGVNPYVLLNCPDDLFAQVRERLRSDQFEFSRYGLCYRPANNGRQYQWYVRLKGTSQLSRRNIEEFFRGKFRAEPDPLEQERHRLESEIIDLEADLSKSRKERDDYETLALEIDSESGLVKQRLSETIEQLQNALTAREFEVQRLKGATRQHASETSGNSRRQSNPGDTLYDIPEHIAEVFRTHSGKNLTPRESLEVISKLFPNRIEILPSGWKASEDSSSFKHRRELLELLWALATEYWGALASGRSDTDAHSVFGNSYAATESERVEKDRRKRRKRTFEYKGAAIEMMRHLKIGTKESTSETIRVHFHWDAVERKIVIGHCGPHL